jgi:hypothetical protein
VTPLSHRPEKRAAQLANLTNPPSPAPKGNQRALKHGGYAEVAREKAGAIFDAIAADVPLRDAYGNLPAADAATVRLLADCLARIDSVSDFLREKGLFAPGGKLRPAVEVESRLRREAADHADALGLSPRSRAKLGLDVLKAGDLAQRWAAEGDADGD